MTKQDMQTWWEKAKFSLRDMLVVAGVLVSVMSFLTGMMTIVNNKFNALPSMFCTKAEANEMKLTDKRIEDEVANANRKLDNILMYFGIEGIKNVRSIHK